MTTSRPLPTIIGPTENALRALLTKTLSTTAIKSYASWVVLNALSRPGAKAFAPEWQGAVLDALKMSQSDLNKVIADLSTKNLINVEGSLTELALAELTEGRNLVGAATSELVDGLSEEAQDTARTVLDHIRTRAEATLQH